jgi:hypothetical protein
VKLEHSQVFAQPPLSGSGHHRTFRTGEEFGDTFVRERRQLWVAASAAAGVGIAEQSAAAVEGGVVEDVVDVPVGTRRAVRSVSDLDLFAGLYGCDSQGAATVAIGVIDFSLGLGGMGTSG